MCLVYRKGTFSPLIQHPLPFPRLLPNICRCPMRNCLDIAFIHLIAAAPSVPSIRLDQILIISIILMEDPQPVRLCIPSHCGAIFTYIKYFISMVIKSLTELILGAFYRRRIGATSFESLPISFHPAEELYIKATFNNTSPYSDVSACKSGTISKKLKTNN